MYFTENGYLLIILDQNTGSLLSGSEENIDNFDPPFSEIVLSIMSIYNILISFDHHTWISTTQLTIVNSLYIELIVTLLILK